MGIYVQTLKNSFASYKPKKMKIKSLLSLLLLSTSVSFAQSPTLIKDIAIGNNGNPQFMTNVNGTLFFVANDGTTGRELWKSDGTQSGTSIVKDINPGASHSQIAKIINFNGKACFRASSNVNGYELWISDGTEAGTKIIKEFGEGNLGIDPSDLIVFKNELYFTERNNTTGVNLWKTDGTETGTVLIKNLYTSGNANNAAYLTVMGNHLYFFAAEVGLLTSDLWKTDGTSAGTSIVISMSGQTGELISTGDKLFFAFGGTGGSATNKGLYITDGTSNGTVKVKDLALSYMINFPTNGTAVYTNNNLIFTANDGVHGEELWKSDGTEAGTVLLKDINTGISDGLDFQPFITKGFGGKVYFVAKDNSFVREIWTSDATEAGTMALDTPNFGSANPNGLYAYNGYVYYRARSTSNLSGEELWRTDGTRTGTVQVFDLWTGFNGSSPNYLCGMNNNLYFSASDGSVGIELYGMPVSPLNTGAFNDKREVISVFPNPADRVLLFSSLESRISNFENAPFGSAQGPARYAIHDTRGRLVQEGTFTENTIDVSGLQSGVYILKVDAGVARFVKN